MDSAIPGVATPPAQTMTRAPAPVVPPSDQARARTFDEHLTAPLSWWLISLLVGGMLGLICMDPNPVAQRFNVPAGLAGTTAGTLLCAAVVVAYGRIGVSVRDGFLEAGTARLPLDALGEVAVLDAEAARELRTTGADMRAFMMLRGYVRTAVKVEVTDPEDPTPYLYLSTRQPEKLAKVLRAAAA